MNCPFTIKLPIAFCELCYDCFPYMIERVAQSFEPSAQLADSDLIRPEKLGIVDTTDSDKI
ncbi:hypothetical protein AO284_27985 [Pseudomonas sp. NZIPFR-PS2]|nr:hypothetical protein AO284_27985 [Pseudomonas sp. NZIPFR-PS2]